MTGYACVNATCPNQKDGMCQVLGLISIQCCVGRRLVDPQYAPGPVELGEWRGWKLGYITKTNAARIRKTDGPWLGWIPGSGCLASAPPEEINALLAAYRCAVDRGLATWPKGYECLAGEMSDWWRDHHVTDKVFLGFTSPNNDFYYAWPCTCDRFAAESRRRAALLGLCEAQPAEKSAEGQVVWLEQHVIPLLKSERDGLKRELSAAKEEVERLKGEIAKSNEDYANLCEALSGMAQQMVDSAKMLSDHNKP